MADDEAPVPGRIGSADTWEDPRRRQAVRGLELTPAARLRWLEETMEALRRWQGRARVRDTDPPAEGDPSGAARP